MYVPLSHISFRLSTRQALFRTHQWEKAIGRYSQAAGFAIQRAPWEAQQIMREELSTVLSNRSAAYFENGDLLSALTDAEAVIQLKKPWSKGHFRKAKALIALGYLAQAREAIQYGLQFDPTNLVSHVLLRGLFQILIFLPAGNDRRSSGHRRRLA